MNNKVITAEQAAEIIKDGQTIATGGFVGIGVPEALLCAIQKRFLKQQKPRDITLVYAAGQGDGKDRGLNHLGEKGLVKRIIGGHWGLVPKLGQLAYANELEAYNLPQGVISHLYRDIAAGKPGTLTHVGLHTFVDPRVDGGKLNAAAKEDLVELLTIGQQEYLFYKRFPIDIALLRGTTADSKGNITMEREALTLEALSIAQAVHNCGGKVLVQVERVIDKHQVSPQLVKIPGILVDAVIVAKAEDHMQTFSEPYNPAYSGELLTEDENLNSSNIENAIDSRLIIGRIAVQYLKPGSIVNLGIGMPEAVAQAATESGDINSITLTVEPGGIGGTPATGLSFGATAYADSIIDQTTQFDFYDGGGLDQAFLGMAEVDELGNVNVSRFGTRTAGAGGFINISQNAKEVFFMGAFTSGKQQVDIMADALSIKQNGSVKKFVKNVQHLTFNGQHGLKNNQKIRFITERGVFRLTKNGLLLEAIVPGIDIQKDIVALMDFKPLVAQELKVLSCNIFN
ncbi:MAG: acyl CoA:acetate/3-ketoacid CoA transferase [Gammaproteobacteria bacterium]|jgi:propionate CoA-transferase|nr:acyl CoA:acetate/3-ketoacid CoA transferase [Gammaproteobacteria bacterium]MBT3724565.1 acyl CoA:acetate/3-ketoacid CoA transferase [Gammaproteobacteria bacterium]MBT4193146.1 acyl CoA:acetate/3-ketoacid CoA transferase [Gammaproteobacteria bacterium]MBT4450281.1 acyl CoA:acetate/3-ketoacid CoA transferase [Gammaproteobacteria bacterium]MBT4860991.1 acyl CoA:acetate/3-ketoacid CoA transferase [Gammaproteobacteria bacterium]